MSAFPIFDPGTVAQIANLLGEAGTGGEISSILSQINLQDNSGESTKWRRLKWAFLNYQERTHTANAIVDYIQNFLAPVRFIGNDIKFETIRSDLNTVLAFEGLEYSKDGRFRKTVPTQTLDESNRRAKSLYQKMSQRGMHSEVYKYCTAELLSNDYFHAVFEASKGLLHRIRELSGQGEDGVELINIVFSTDKPILAFNTLQTAIEQIDHKGFAQLLKGCHAAVRNPTAHTPKLLWDGEPDALDYLSLISLLHKKLDHCIKVRR